MTHPSVLNKEQMMEESLIAAHAAIKELSKRIVEKASIRDQFAMFAMLGVLMRHDHLFAETVAEVAYHHADAMLEARK